ncbi:nitroreductase family deazaflavin-dependent oxidoreductase [Actinomadura fibrosa]|uniref:Nitroreductase family deazaflavin-dependent oxidoreductase n=1 Tax=Actinomadura fibrosa TaxID=111802 RepID=A0ABW2XYV2_9ACTN|nr:nitroreductase family deazaflavin-dependent oxidoreductase [Actinomadura fibrosa]
MPRSGAAASGPPKGLDSPLMPKILKVMSRANVAVYRATGGRVGGRWRVGAAFPRGVPVCLLTTRGRKTGRARTLPLLFMEDGERVVLVASQGGAPRNPLWYLNLLAEPRVVVQVRRDVRRMRARTAEEGERAELWPRLVAMYADFDRYQSWTDRRIPVVICEPVRDGAADDPA